MSLTKREKEICRYILDSQGMFDKNSISRDFKIAWATVHKHFDNIYTKLCINSQTELVYLLCTDKSILEE